jgi:hypothetical protein
MLVDGQQNFAKEYRYYSLDPGGIGHWVTIAGPSIWFEPFWNMPWKWIVDVSL